MLKQIYLFLRKAIIFRGIINYELKDIIVSGYSEKQENFYLFSPMYWWIYLQFDNFYIVLDSNSGHITTKIADKIECYFDIEEEDKFTVFSHSKCEYGCVLKVELFTDEKKNLIGIGLIFNNHYILFNALDINGFVVSIHSSRITAIHDFAYINSEIVD